ncbi:MAG: hypothetical protein JSV05_06520 [Candidatus Bathyarchaeota archaeon]|nr:MAG: hypothetical protein JSV05_06520 [Candidatus Bathyarchaeota archaeon]
MSFPQALTTRYFQLIKNRQFTEAQRELQRIKQKTPKTTWNHGYCKALQGMLLARKSNGNQYTFLQNLNINDNAQLLRYKKEFQKHLESRFHEDFDRGFFSAWNDYTRLLIKTLEEAQPEDNEGQTRLIHYTNSSQPSK